MRNVECRRLAVGLCDLRIYLRSHGIVISGSGERPAQFADLPRGFIDSDHIPTEKRKAQSEFLEEWGSTITLPAIMCFSDREGELCCFHTALTRSLAHSPSLDFLFSEAFNHLIAQVIDGLHLCSLQRQFAHFRTLTSKETSRKERLDAHMENPIPQI